MAGDPQIIKSFVFEEISEVERTPLVVSLLEVIQYLVEENQKLKDEIMRLKGEKGRPEIKPSSLENVQKDPQTQESAEKQKQRKKNWKKRKNKNLRIHKIEVIKASDIPEGSRFKGYKEYIVQDIEIKLKNTLYYLERWETPEGKYISGQLPPEILEHHFGPTLRSYVLYQYYQQHVTQGLILEHLKEFGVDISEGQINRIITEGHDNFHEEKDNVLKVGLEVSRYVQVDDTQARHKGKNGFCTHIGNELFTWFQSTSSKSRVNFLELLRSGHTDYVLTQEALEYMKQLGLPHDLLSQLEIEKSFPNLPSWEAYLTSVQMTNPLHVRIATEGALVGSILSHGVSKELVILSDDAGQFAILGFLHALCWIHAERTINKLIPFSDASREAHENVRDQIWNFYQDLKSYKQAPSETKKIALAHRFDEIFTQKTCFQSLNLALTRLFKNKKELLLVLDRPEIPLHNNLSENDIRDYVKKRKISATTRSDSGRRCRDTFLSLKKTCRKLHISFWGFLFDRVSKQNSIAPLPDLITAAARGP